MKNNKHYEKFDDESNKQKTPTPTPPTPSDIEIAKKGIMALAEWACTSYAKELTSIRNFLDIQGEQKDVVMSAYRVIVVHLILDIGNEMKKFTDYMSSLDSTNMGDLCTVCLNVYKMLRNFHFIIKIWNCGCPTLGEDPMKSFMEKKA